jgi:hypothetical protein
MTRKDPVEMSGWLWDAFAVEQAQEHLDSALVKLRAEGEVTLIDQERRALQVWIKEHSAERKRPRGRPPADTVSIALACQMYEGFWPTKVAVATVAESYGVSPAVVYAARRKLLLSK